MSKKNITNSTNEFAVKCAICNIYYKSSDELRKHTENCQKYYEFASSNGGKCPSCSCSWCAQLEHKCAQNGCGLVFKCFFGLKIHLAKDHNKKITTNSTNDEFISYNFIMNGEKIKCTACSNIFNTIQNYSAHTRGEYKCHYIDCNFTFKCNLGLQYHIAEDHMKIQRKVKSDFGTQASDMQNKSNPSTTSRIRIYKYKCKECDMFWKSEEDLKKHTEHCHSRNPSCKVYSNMKTYQKHPEIAKSISKDLK